MRIDFFTIFVIDMTLLEINSILKDGERYRHKVLKMIAEECNTHESKVRNVLLRRNISIDIQTKVAILEAAENLAQVYKRDIEKIKEYENE